MRKFEMPQFWKRAASRGGDMALIGFYATIGDDVSFARRAHDTALAAARAFH